MVWFLPLIKLVLPWAVGLFLGKKAIESFGSTPNNRAVDSGISSRDIYEYSRKDKKEKLDFLKEKNEEKNKELLEGNKKLKEDIEKLEKRLLKESEDWKNESDLGEKAKKLAIMETTQKELNSAKGQLTTNENIMKKNEADIAKLYDELSKGGEKLTEEQLHAKNNYPDLKSLLNWGIISISVIIGMLIIKFIFGFFKSLNKETN